MKRWRDRRLHPENLVHGLKGHVVFLMATATDQTLPREYLLDLQYIRKNATAISAFQQAKETLSREIDLLKKKIETLPEASKEEEQKVSAISVQDITISKDHGIDEIQCLQIAKYGTNDQIAALLKRIEGLSPRHGSQLKKQEALLTHWKQIRFVDPAGFLEKSFANGTLTVSPESFESSDPEVLWILGHVSKEHRAALIATLEKAKIELLIPPQ